MDSKTDSENSPIKQIEGFLIISYETLNGDQDGRNAQ
jgi:hypothetical protein